MAKPVIPRTVIATMYNGLSKEKVWVRHYSYFDTAVPRATQLLISYGSAGDFVEFASTDLGFQLGILRFKSRTKIQLEMSELIRDCPSILKMVQERH